MDKDRIAGSAKDLAGKVENTVGDIAGDTKTQAEGRAREAAGWTQPRGKGLDDPEPVERASEIGLILGAVDPRAPAELQQRRRGAAEDLRQRQRRAVDAVP